MPKTGYIGLRVPAAEKYGVLCLRISDFWHHKNEVIHRILPHRERIVVTAWGHPDFEVHRVPVEASRSVERRDADSKYFMERDGWAYVPTTWFQTETWAYLTTVLPDRGRLIITRYGEPDWMAVQPSWEARTVVEYGGRDALGYDAPEEVEIPPPEVHLRDEE